MDSPPGLSIVTWNVQASPVLAVQITVVVPTGKKDPETALQLTVAGVPPSPVGWPQSPDVPGLEKFTMAPAWPASALCVMFSGQLNTQGATTTAVDLLSELLSLLVSAVHAVILADSTIVVARL